MTELNKSVYGMSLADYEMKMLQLKKQQEIDEYNERAARRNALTNIGANLYKSFSTDRATKVSELLKKTDPKNRAIYTRKDMSFIKSLDPRLKPEDFVNKIDYSQQDIIEDFANKIKPLEKYQSKILSEMKVNTKPNPISVSNQVAKPMSVSNQVTKPNYSSNLKAVDPLPSGGDPNLSASKSFDAMGTLGKVAGGVSLVSGLKDMASKDFKRRKPGSKLASLVGTGAGAASLFGLAGPWGWVSLGSQLVKGLIK